MRLITVYILICSLLVSANANKILGVFPIAAASHFSIGSSLMKGLAEKGHDITLIAAYKDKSPIPKYKTVFVSEAVSYMDGKND